MAANAWRILVGLREKIRKADEAYRHAADELAEACTFAPGLDLAGGIDMDTWERLDHAARSRTDLREVLDAAIQEVSWMQPFGCVEDIRDARALVRVLRALAEDFNAQRAA